MENIEKCGFMEDLRNPIDEYIRKENELKKMYADLQDKLLKQKKEVGKMNGKNQMMTEKQKSLIDDMNEFCTEKFEYDENTTKAEARDYISRNIEQFKLLTMDDWQMEYL